MSGIIAQNTLDNSGLIKSPAGGGAWNFISKQTASASADISFTSGIDSTYKEYIFTFNNIHPATDDVVLSFQVDTGTNTSYNQTVTSTNFAAQHGESDSPTELSETGPNRRLAQQTIFQPLSGHNDLGNDNDQCLSGYLHIFNPASTTFVKHFMAVTNQAGFEDRSVNSYIGGYFNTTTALTRVQFKMSSGNMDAGDICLYGISS